jgi:hypothetical protein
MLNTATKVWLSALRSGLYKQGRKRLKHAGRYCCLGVACQISSIVEPKDWIHKTLLEASAEPVQNELGLERAAGSFKVGAYAKYPQADSLVDLNDKYRVSFTDIADFIESEPEGLFYQEKK